VFAALALSAPDGTVALPLRLLAARAGISVTQTRRALKRLVATKLVEITEPGRGRRATVFRLRWRLPSFPQAFVPPPPNNLPPENSRNLNSRGDSCARTACSLSELPLRNRKAALRWVMFHLRREVSRWGLPPPRREALLTGLGQAIWRAIRRRLVRTTAQLRRLLHEVLGHLRDAPEGISASLRRACGYSGAIVLLALRSLGLVPWRPSTSERLEPDPTEALQRRLEDLRRLYLAPWLSDEESRRIAEEVRRFGGDECPS